MIRGPDVWTKSPHSPLRLVSVGCRECGWAAEKDGVYLKEVDQEVERAREMFKAHECNVGSR